jgi:hypothetical protein
LISGSFLSFPFIKKMSSYIIRLCCSWFWNISVRSLINLFLLSIRSFWNWKNIYEESMDIGLLQYRKKW